MGTVVIFVDLVGSTEEMRRLGTARATLEREKRLAYIERHLKSVDAFAMRIGLYQGDGMLMVGQDASGLLRECMRLQGEWSGLREGLPCRIAVGEGDPQWIGTPWGETSNVSGTIVNQTHRLVDACHSGGIVIDAGMYNNTLEDTLFTCKLQRKEINLRGLGSTVYWEVLLPAQGEITDDRTEHLSVDLQLIQDMLLKNREINREERVQVIEGLAHEIALVKAGVAKNIHYLWLLIFLLVFMNVPPFIRVLMLWFGNIR
jgi:class 3 adenylate cyclase